MIIRAFLIVFLAMAQMSLSSSVSVIPGLELSENEKPFVDKRPPTITPIQRKMFRTLTKGSSHFSREADRVLTQLAKESIFSNNLTGLPIEKASVAEIVNILLWEFSRIPIMHKAHSNFIMSTLNTGFLANQCQLYLTQKAPVAVREITFNYNQYCSVFMTKYLTFPKFSDTANPALRETNDRPLHAFANVGKTAFIGDLMGQGVYVINRNIVAHGTMFLASDMAVGGNSKDIGTLDAFSHLIPGHLSSYNYSLIDLFQRWYKDTGREIAHSTYSHSRTPSILLETVISRNVWLPGGLHYFIASYSKHWGTPLGSKLRQSMIYLRRPLVWTDNNMEGMLLDPVVHQLSGLDIGKPEARLLFSGSNWSPHRKTSFAELYAKSPLYLQFHFQSYFASRPVCMPIEQSLPTAQVMGSTTDGQCVYWLYRDPLPLKWECLNDGTCEVSNRGTFESQKSCLETCSVKAKWSCKYYNDDHLRKNSDDVNKDMTDRNLVIPTSICVQDPDGGCQTLVECERNCKPNKLGKSKCSSSNA